jgi:hypothetical protein
MPAESDWNKKDLISKGNIIKHPLLSNLIKFISIYVLRHANVSTIC